MKKNLIVSLIGIALLAGTNAYADEVSVLKDQNGLNVLGSAIVSGDARVAKGLVVEGDQRVEGTVLFGQYKKDDENNLMTDAQNNPIIDENYVTVISGNVNASGNVYSANSSIEGNWTKIQDVESRLSSVDGRLSGVEKRLSDVKKTSYRGIAAVTAIANIPTVEQGKRFAVGVGVGNFEGENALAIGASIRANDSLTFKASAGKSGSSATYGAGAALSF
ncbi:YadA C-terminal domain-containing protein [Oxalobacter aliiformigenes]|uniref:YadA C-terminal domain-containing protein n=1 Tax=Oxalobacter aliiformigenes TaxID=2946593 RepID=UPI0022AE88CF|nr:YadA C-terminal domain-containing protein [Oxalobacter aliiformigenes]MCZ4065983.1 YadA C-terminal domain-containing protein [Oxalobacter aliiformigenes]WAW00209.1 YadA C-terminal domain-containing protein [Oxalobacter aliiformigenes]